MIDIRTREDSDNRARIRAINLQRMASVTTASVEPPSLICEECGLEECSCD